jgi:hypothetical protein
MCVIAGDAGQGGGGFGGRQGGGWNGCVEVRKRGMEVEVEVVERAVRVAPASLFLSFFSVPLSNSPSPTPSRSATVRYPAAKRRARTLGARGKACVSWRGRSEAAAIEQKRELCGRLERAARVCGPVCGAE